MSTPSSSLQSGSHTVSSLSAQREEADELCRTPEQNGDKSRTASKMADVMYHSLAQKCKNREGPSSSPAEILKSEGGADLLQQCEGDPVHSRLRRARSPSANTEKLDVAGGGARSSATELFCF
ncbi:hypothetical protein QYF36_000845 [Acer negundo]|nr:hypothetical protein QYF36_000845 [Acer negundo]